MHPSKPEATRSRDSSGATDAFQEGAGPTIDFLCVLFARHSARGGISISEPGRAAAAFLNLAVGGPARIIGAGNVLAHTEIQQHIRFAVALFLRCAAPGEWLDVTQSGCSLVQAYQSHLEPCIEDRISHLI